MTTISDYLDFIAEETGHRPPTHWEICGYCRGNGTSSAYLGAFTSEEMHDLGDDFAEDYINGMYDQPCPECEGTGKVRVLAEGTEAHEGWLNWLAEDAADRHTRWAESGYSDL